MYTQYLSTRRVCKHRGDPALTPSTRLHSGSVSPIACCGLSGSEAESF